MKFGLDLGFEFCVIRHGFSAKPRIGVVPTPKVKAVNPSNEHLAWKRGGDFFTPKLLLISTNLIKFMLILRIEISLGELSVEIEKL